MPPVLPARTIVDTHTHTLFSDGTGTFAENAAAAASRGCRVLVSTDHLTLPPVMDPAGSVQVVVDEREAHRSAFEAAAAACQDVEYLFGFECDWYPGCAENIRRWGAGARVLLGSVHWIGSQDDGAWIDDPDDQRIWDELGPDEVWRRYVDAWCDAAASGLFDTMAHPDLPMRFANEGYAPTIALAPLWDRMVDCAADTAMRVELSTAGWRKGVGDYYPACGLLERFQRAGVSLTVGSDAHLPGDIGWGIERAYDHAARFGFRTVDVPRLDGSWEHMPIV